MNVLVIGASRGFTGLRLNPRQESNVLHMHTVIDEYLKL